MHLSFDKTVSLNAWTRLASRVNMGGTLKQYTWEEDQILKRVKEILPDQTLVPKRKNQFENCKSAFS